MLDMLRRIPVDEYERFWKEYSTNIKLGVMEDPSNRARLAKLLRFHSSRGADAGQTFLQDYVERMQPAQKHIYYIAGASLAEVPPHYYLHLFFPFIPHVDAFYNFARRRYLPDNFHLFSDNV